jgi:hypothetical protein
MRYRQGRASRQRLRGHECCAFTVERAHERPEFRCTNRRFFDVPDTAPGALRAFDLRQGLEAA